MISAKPIAVAAVLALTAGCVTDAVEVPAKGTVAQRNRENLERLSPGMSWEEVAQIMGEGQPGDAADTPYEVESFLLDGPGHGRYTSVRLVFYVTQDSGLDHVVQDDLTLLLFLDETLASRGEEARKLSSFYRRFRVDPYPWGPPAFGEVVRVEADRITILLSEDSPTLTGLDYRFAVYKDDTYKGDVRVMENRGRVLYCRPILRDTNIAVGDSASIYLK